MSLRALRWAFSLALPPTPKFVLIALADHADDAGICWPYTTHLATKTGFSTRTIRAALSNLKACALIATQKRSRHRPQLTLALDVEEVPPPMRAHSCTGSHTRTLSTEPAQGAAASPCQLNGRPEAGKRQVVPQERHEVPPYRTLHNPQKTCIDPSTPLCEPLSGERPQQQSQGHRSEKGACKIASKMLDEIPSFIPREAWSGYLEMRTLKGACATRRAVSLLVKKLETFHAQGHDIGTILDRSTLRGWTDLYAPPPVRIRAPRLYRASDQSPSLSKTGHHTARMSPFYKPSPLAQQANRLRAQWETRCGDS